MSCESTDPQLELSLSDQEHCVPPHVIRDIPYTMYQLPFRGHFTCQADMAGTRTAPYEPTMDELSGSTDSLFQWTPFLDPRIIRFQADLAGACHPHKLTINNLAARTDPPTSHDWEAH
jgi:hypothetical protein